MGLMFDGIDLKQKYGFVVTEINGRGSPSVTRTTLELEYVDGVVELSQKLNPRNLTVRGYVYGENAHQKKNDLISLVSRSYSEEKELIFPDTNRSIFVKLNGEPFVLSNIGPILNAVAYEITFDFIAHDPVFYGETYDEIGGGLAIVPTCAPIYFVTPSRTFLLREPTIELYPYTAVNLLGIQGNFETGTGGLGTGWINTGTTPTLDNDAVFGQKSQKITIKYLSGSQFISHNIDVKANHKYFVSMYIKNSTNADAAGVLGKVEFGGTVISDAQIYQDWTQIFGIYTPTATGSQTLRIYLTDDATSNLDKTYTEYIDGVMIVDLTEMGSLPPILKEYFSNTVTTWADLASTNYFKNKYGYRIRGTEWLATLVKYSEMQNLTKEIKVYGKLSYIPDVSFEPSKDAIPLPESIQEYYPNVLFGIIENSVVEGFYILGYNASDLKRTITFQNDLIGYGNYIDYFDGENIYKCWKKKVGTTDSSGNIALTGYLAGTLAIAVNNATGEVKTSDVASSLGLGWINTDVTVYYVGAAVETEKMIYDDELILYPDENYLVLENFAMKVSGRRKYFEG